MLQIEGLREGLPIFKTLGSEVRMKIVELLAEEGSRNLNEIATALGLTNSAVTSHVRKLEEAGIIQVEADLAGKGNQKVCSLKEEQLLLYIRPPMQERNANLYEAEIPIGAFQAIQVHPSCGIALKDGPFGREDDPVCFYEPGAREAQLLWFQEGLIEYKVPDLLPPDCTVAQLTLSFEISSSDWEIPSRVFFFLEDKPLGSWLTFPNDKLRGYHTPAWYREPWRQHGFLKMLVINRGGVFLDGVQIAESPGEEALGRSGRTPRFRIETRALGEETGGIALYGDSFGHYRQNILARVHWVENELIGEREK